MRSKAAVGERPAKGSKSAHNHYEDKRQLHTGLRHLTSYDILGPRPSVAPTTSSLEQITSLSVASSWT